MNAENRLYPKTYGAWAGNPDGHKPDFTKCCQQVARSQGRWTSFGQCTRKRRHGPDGAYCATHNPDAVRARSEKATARYNEQHNKERYAWHGRAFYAVLKQIADGHNDARGLAAETIAKFHEGEK